MQTHTHSRVISPEAFLETAYRELEYDQGCLLSATSQPATDSSEFQDWVNKGDWLTLAETVGAETIFFVENDPVIVFCKSQEATPTTINAIYQRVWCMARPQCLFIATPGELKVYSLNQSPIRPDEHNKIIAPLESPLHTLEQVSERLQAYRREKVETGDLFVAKRFGNVANRADRRLITDLKTTRKSLMSLPINDLKLHKSELHKRYIHALIGRSIFVRYLEDCKIIELDYFEQVAKDTACVGWSQQWLEILHTQDALNLTPKAENQWFAHVLRNKDFAYALFKQLAYDFNGDMFPNDEGEEALINEGHLEILRNFLLGNPSTGQRRLFFWAYDFEIIPIELISSIYEEFYQSTDDSENGTHYTPSVLVEYVLAETLTHDRLLTKPKILDFACGSGIFLVQAFRRIVRHCETQLGRVLNSHELRQIIRDQIRGVEINNEAVHVAAFSLYLALLHYQEPKSIIAQIKNAGEQKPLPSLIWNSDYQIDSSHFSVLFCSNAFHLMKSERILLASQLAERKRLKFKKERQALIDSEATLPFEANSFDVIVGNPPWGYLKRNEGTPYLRREQQHTLNWCKAFGWKIGDKELSQAFVARALSLLRGNGVCGLLISSGVLLKQGETSQIFRKSWLSKVTVDKVTNFTHVRHIYFSGAVSPFCFLQFRNQKADSAHHLEYWSAKRTAVVEQTKSIVLSLPDIHIAQQRTFIEGDFLWKTYWWGNHHDASLIRRLKLDFTLSVFVNTNKLREPRSGFEGVVASYDTQDSEWLLNFKELPIELFRRYGQIDAANLIMPPEKVNRKRSQYIYEGSRILVKRGINQRNNENGRVVARLENMPYSFRNSIYSIRFNDDMDWQQKVIIGVLWSSVARYFFFMTMGSWGLWADELKLHNGLLSLPIRFPKDISLRTKIVDIVGDLQAGRFLDGTLTNYAKNKTLNPNLDSLIELERKLDEAIFELFEIGAREGALINDLCKTGLEFFYRKSKSQAVKPVEIGSFEVGKMEQVVHTHVQESDVTGYLDSFLSIWNRELQAFEREFHWQFIWSPSSTMLALVFTAKPLNEPLKTSQTNDRLAWNKLLHALEETAYQPIAQNVYIDQMIRYVTDTQITIIKRNTKRLWTRSLGWEDAEATLLQAMSRKDN